MDNRYGKNPAGATDLTPAKAERNIDQELKRVGDLVHVLRYVADGAGFSIMGRMVLRDTKTGREYK